MGAGPILGSTPVWKAALAASAALLIGGVVVLARERAGPPARCAPGMVALGPRCCGEGQRLEAGRCAGAPRRCAAGLAPTPAGCTAPSVTVRIAAGTLRLGPSDWEAQGLVDPRAVFVPAFSLDAFEVTEARYAACVAAAACAPLPLRGEPGLPVTGITLGEAARYCAFVGGALPSRDQLAFAAAGPSSRRYPWGDTGAVCRRAAFGLRAGPCGWGATGPELAGSHPDGAAIHPDGRVFDLAGNVAEWAAPERTGQRISGIHGGSWSDGAAAALRTWNRRIVPDSTRATDIGFRCAHSP
ncbi:SUMF1/EgtB/PvdO family nonheme iron enzyme [Sorangium sp. So ce1036]|uniref:formylglycine-generating enzyme family protein n=1 Tax=Sorangium sp. So ce1036 TaxID=3133328 RepID=UPI003F01C02F